MSSPQLNASNPAHVVQTIRLDQGYFSRRSMTDWGFAALLLVATALVFARYGASMDYYEKTICSGLCPP
jgi:hypothetical protein